MKLRKIAVPFSVTLAILIAPLMVRAYVLEPYYWKDGVSGLTYKWGSNLQTSGTVIRTAFENALSDWNERQPLFGFPTAAVLPTRSTPTMFPILPNMVFATSRIQAVRYSILQLWLTQGILISEKATWLEVQPGMN